MSLSEMRAAVNQARNQEKKESGRLPAETYFKVAEMMKRLGDYGSPEFYEKAIAAARIRAYHERQKKECGSDGFTYTEADGTVLGQKVTPLDRVGIYVPGGKAAYPSSVIMNVVPAQVAGVPRIVVATPPRTLSENPAVAAALVELGKARWVDLKGHQSVSVDWPSVMV